MSFAPFFLSPSEGRQPPPCPRRPAHICSMILLSSTPSASSMYMPSLSSLPLARAPKVFTCRGGKDEGGQGSAAAEAGASGASRRPPAPQTHPGDQRALQEELQELGHGHVHVAGRARQRGRLTRQTKAPSPWPRRRAAPAYSGGEPRLIAPRPGGARRRGAGTGNGGGAGGEAAAARGGWARRLLRGRSRSPRSAAPSRPRCYLRRGAASPRPLQPRRRDGRRPPPMGDAERPARANGRRKGAGGGEAEGAPARP